MTPSEPITVVDTSGLHCPMPLLKLKIALRDQTDGTSIRLISTDPTSQQDVQRYCEIAGLTCTQHMEDPAHSKFVFNITKP
jgi:TusA-related sulfurtransferase